MKGHVLPGALPLRITPGDRSLVRPSPDPPASDGGNQRLCRCLRCDAWILTDPPEPDDTTPESLPPHDELPRPTRGEPLREQIILRLIALERAFHSVVFGLLAAGLAVFEWNLGGLRDSAKGLVDSAQSAVDASSRAASHSWLAEQLERLVNIDDSTVVVLLIVSLAYFVLEGTEAIGLWMGKRWAEYLTVLATAGFLPLELRELVEKITVVRVAALTINVAILIYLVWSKRLFGLRGGGRAMRAAREQAVSWDDLYANPPVTPPDGGRAAKA